MLTVSSTIQSGVQYLSIRYTERLLYAGAVVTTVGSRGDAYDCDDYLAVARVV
jgi:hypothetical protein